MMSRSRDHRVLARTSAELAASDPRLAAMLAMFTQLAAPEGQPPDESLITGRPWPDRAPPAGRARAAVAACRRHRPDSRTLWLAMIPTAALALLALTMALGLAANFGCPSGPVRPGPGNHAITPPACRFRATDGG